jgi:hypothetical protein
MQLLERSLATLAMKFNWPNAGVSVAFPDA